MSKTTKPVAALSAPIVDTTSVQLAPDQRAKTTPAQAKRRKALPEPVPAEAGEAVEALSSADPSFADPVMPGALTQAAEVGLAADAIVGVALDGAPLTTLTLGKGVQYAQVSGGAISAGTAGATSASAGSAAIASAWSPLWVVAGLGVGAVALARRSDDEPLREQSGKVIDGYLAGATVFLDVDGDGEQDANEPSTTTDANGNFVLRSNQSGTLIARGGKDTVTNLDFEGVLKAPPGSTAVTPLTTLVTQLVKDGASTSAAQAQVLAALGLSNLGTQVDLTRFDPVANLQSSNADTAAAALAVQKAGVTVATLVQQLSETIVDAASQTSQSAFDQVAGDIYGRLAKQLAPGQLTASNLGSATAQLIDTLAQQTAVGGVQVDASALTGSKAALSGRLENFAQDVEQSTSLSEIGTTQKTALGVYTLQLLHFADAEAGALASRTAPNLAALVDAFEDDFANSITLAGGDNFLPGPFLAAGTDDGVRQTFNTVTGSSVTGTMPIAALDIALHNLMGVQASAVGNHEFDLGSNVLVGAFGGGSGFAGAQFPYVSANLDVSGDSALKARYTDTTAQAGLEEAADLKGKLVPSAVITEGGEKIGVVGATTQLLVSISSPSGTVVKGGATGDDMALLATQLQPVIDDLIAQGVNKIILLSHLQNINNEKALAPLLSGVDIIVAAGSNTRLGDADDKAENFPGHPATFADTYPLVLQDKDQGTTLIVNTDNEFTYLGRLVIDFDKDGRILVPSLSANTAINGAYAATASNVAQAWGVQESALESTAFASGTRGAQVKALTDAVQSVIDAKDGKVYGYSDVYLEGERIAVRNQETNLGSLSADANGYALAQALGSAAAETFIVSLKNGGGIRAQIGTISAPKADGTVDKLPPSDGSVSQLDVENSLRFNNQLMAFDTTPQGLKAILEHGVAVLGSQGRFPQVGGVSFAYDPDLPAGSRITDVALGEGAHAVGLYDNGILLAQAPAKITVVTLNFLANGGDNYPIKANGENFRYVVEQADGSVALTAAVDESKNFTAADTIDAARGSSVLLGEQKAFENYMKAFHGSPEMAYEQPDVPEALDERIQNLNVRSESVLPDGPFALASSLKLAGAEISAFDPDSSRLFVTSSKGLQVVELAADLSMKLLGTVELGSNDINSVAVKNGVLAVAVAAADKTQPGSVYLLDAGASLTVANGVISPSAPFVRGSVLVGALPDMLTFTPDGTKLLVANEGERNTPGDIEKGKSAIDPEGSVSIIDLAPVLAAGAPSDAVPTVSTASFASFNSQLAALKAKGVRLFAGEKGFESVTVAQDLEPEYIAISPDGKTAMVTLQENNAIAVLDMASGTITDIVPLGLKDFSGLKLDANDRDGVPLLKTGLPVHGLYMPDAIASFTGADGKTYYAIANEGDDRDDFLNPGETIRVGSKDYVLDPTVFPNAAELKADAMLGRLTVSNAPGHRGDTDGDGDIDKIIAYGARSFSILDAQGNMVFDSGSQLEEFVAVGGLFKAATPATSGLFDDSRSDNKGPEPEGITVGVVGGRTLAFVGLERGGGGVMVYDVTHPAQAQLVQYLRNPTDVSPEGLSFVEGAHNPAGRDLLFVTNEVSGTVSVFASNMVSQPSVGDVMFVAANADAPDAFAFVLLRPFEAGARIGLTDRNYSQANGFSSLDESALMWTADQSYPAGTVVTVQTEASGSTAVADKGVVVGRGGGLSTSAETIYAFVGDIAGLAQGAAGAITVDHLLASLTLGDAAGDVPDAIAATSQRFAEDNVRYTGSLDASDPAALALLIDNTANWQVNDSTAYPLSNGSLFPL